MTTTSICPSVRHLWAILTRKSEDKTKKNKALFLDGDGVVIDYLPYLSKPEQVSIPAGGQAVTLKQWQDAGSLLNHHYQSIRTC